MSIAVLLETGPLVLPIQPGQTLNELQKNMDYRELSGLPQFNNAYIDAMMFPEEG